jgi:3-oxoacyl-[acyl-carrier protein] reductase
MAGTLEGRTALVTGAGNGIGRAIADRFGEAGASVVLVDVAEDDLAETASDLRSRGIEVATAVCDVTSLSDVRDVATVADERFGGTDVLVNNAGATSRGSFAELTPETWRHVLEVNLTGAFNCVHAVAPGMLDREYGRIVNVASMAGRNVSYYGGPDYTASKWGLIGLTKHLAWELGPSITVNALCPGPTLTGRFRRATDDQTRRDNEAKVPLDRLADPADQAAAALFLASDEADYVTGTTLDVDGGLQLSVRVDA